MGTVSSPSDSGEVCAPAGLYCQAERPDHVRAGVSRQVEGFLRGRGHVSSIGLGVRDYGVRSFQSGWEPQRLDWGIVLEIPRKWEGLYSPIRLGVAPRWELCLPHQTRNSK